MTAAVVEPIAGGIPGERWTDSTLAAAATFLAHGLQPIPIKADGSKSPALSEWKHLRDRRATDDDLIRWYMDHPERGVGIVCGAISGDLVAIDADVSGDRPGWPMLEAAIAAAGGDLAAGWQEAKAGWLDETPSGGRHVLIRVPGVEIGNVKLAASATGKPFVETRGEGGQIVCPPSGGAVHPTGRPYRLLAGGPDTIATMTPDWWAALVEACATFDERTAHGIEAAPRGTTWNGDGADTRPGTEFNRRASWPALLQEHGFTIVRQSGRMLRVRRPGKTDGESGSVFLDAGAGGILVMWSTSVDALEGGGKYSPFGFLTAMRHGGDFAAAGQALAAARGPVLHLNTPARSAQEDRTPMANPAPADAGDPGPRHDGAAGNVVDMTGEPVAAADDLDPIVATGQGSIRLTDIGNADRLAERVRDRFACVLIDQTKPRWLHYAGGVWSPSMKGEIQREAKASITEAYAMLPDVEPIEARKALEKHLKASEQATRIAAAISLSVSVPGIAVTDDEFDCDPLLLNVENGTLDLRTGRLRPHDPADRLSKMARVAHDPDATAPAWEAFLSRVLPDPDVRRYVRTLFGFAMTGRTADIVPVAWGRGANGKSTLVDTLQFVLGDYAIQSPIETFMDGKASSSGATPELARLQGARVVFTSEGSEDQRLNVGRLKMLTGGERIAARRLYRDQTEFTPTHTVWISTNHRPIVPGDDAALWRRLQLVPFRVVIPESERDPDLKDKLRAEAPGILNWLMAGYADYVAAGRFVHPAAVREATEEYRSDNDDVGNFIAKHCIEEPRAREAARVLYDSYRNWVFTEYGQTAEPATAQAFGRNLKQRGYDAKHTRTGKMTLGIRLRRPDEGPATFPDDDNAGD